MALAPVDHELLEVAGAKLSHLTLSLGMRLDHLETCVGPVSQQDAVAVTVEQHESSNEQHAEGQQCP